jgi:hypothetical protein
MRQGQQNNKRMRNRNRKGPNPLQRSYESNGGDVKIRGTALHVAEKYVQLARDAQSSGDRVAGENYLQHAEHYYRIVAAAQAQMPQPQQIYRNDDGDGDDEDEFGNPQSGNTQGGGGGGYRDNTNYGGGNNSYQGNRQPQQGGQQPGGHAAYGIPEQAPAFLNGNNAPVAGTAPGSVSGGQESPYEGSQPQQADTRGQGSNVQQGNGGQGPGGNNFRQRRRRPFREQYAGGEPPAAPVEQADNSGGDVSGDD